MLQVNYINDIVSSLYISLHDQLPRVVIIRDFYVQLIFISFIKNNHTGWMGSTKTCFWSQFYISCNRKLLPNVDSLGLKVKGF